LINIYIVIIEILDQSFDPWAWAKACQDGEHAQPHKAGATSLFIGTMRDFNEGDDVQSMVLEHYPEMTQKHLNQIAESAMQKWHLIDLAIAHRVGEIFPGDAIVCVAVWASHRKEAYEANRMIMEELKSSVPFWKKEQLKNGSRWVEKNTKGF
jgi:molybdopterin synthase catalytic subunit